MCKISPVAGTFSDRELPLFRCKQIKVSMFTYKPPLYSQGERDSIVQPRCRGEALFKFIHFQFHRLNEKNVLFLLG